MDLEMPMVNECSCIPQRILPFNECMSTKDHDSGVHFFIDDYQFERLWKFPERYLPVLKRFYCIFAPDFSLYMNTPLPLQNWNTYRNRLLAAWMQHHGLNVIPTVSWAGVKSFDFCFEGLPAESTLAISTVGSAHRKNYVHWKRGMDEMIDRLNPKVLLIYGSKLDYDYKDIETICYPNGIISRFNAL